MAIADYAAQFEVTRWTTPTCGVSSSHNNCAMILPCKPEVAKKVVRKAPVRKGEPNIINKLFAMPFIGGGKGVTLGPEYDL